MQTGRHDEAKSIFKILRMCLKKLVI